MSAVYAAPHPVDDKWAQAVIAQARQIRSLESRVRHLEGENYWLRTIIERRVGERDPS